MFVWVLLMNAMDFLPADLVGRLTRHVSEHGFRYRADGGREHHVRAVALGVGC